MRQWSVRIAAALTAVMGAINLLSATTPPLHRRVAVIAAWSPLEVRHGSAIAAAVSGFALLLLARSLWRRKHAGWLVTELVLLVSAVSHVLKGLDLEEAAVATGLALFLLAIAPEFHARSDAPSVQRALWVVAGSLVFNLAYGVTGFYLLDRHYSVDFGFWAAVRQTVVMFTQFYDPGLEPVTQFGRWFADSIYIVSVLTTGYALAMLVRPVLVRERATPGERLLTRGIVEAHGRSSLARLTLMDDKSYYFGPGGTLVAFVVKARVGLALGDPIGPLDQIGPAIAGFGAHCARNDWRPAFYQTMPDHLALYREAGLETLCIGHEAIVDLASFTLEGQARKALRGAVNRLTRLGFSARLHEPPLDDGLMRQLEQVSDEWLALRRGGEKRFSLGWFDEDYIRESPVMTVETAHGAITAFSNLMPEYQLNEITTDLMRHRARIQNGTMDFLFAELFRWAKGCGYATFNLGLCALAGVGRDPKDPVAERALGFIFEHVNQFYDFKGLHAFKSKFHPIWSPRYLVYPGPASLPAVAVALILADSGTAVLWRREKARPPRVGPEAESRREERAAS